MVAAVFVLTVVSHSGILMLPFFSLSLSQIKNNSLISGKSVEGCFPKCQLWGSVDQEKLG